MKIPVGRRKHHLNQIEGSDGALFFCVLVKMGIPFDAVAQENLSPDVLPEKYSLLSKT